MHRARWVLFLAVIGAVPGTATAATQKQAKTDAEQDGLNGAVHRVSMVEQDIRAPLNSAGVDPAAVLVVENIESQDVEYDASGYRTKSGKLNAASGEFEGQATEVKRDATARVVERTVSLLPTQDVLEHEVYGPFGLVEATSYAAGKATNVHTIRYDRQGSVQEDTRTDGEGKPIFRTLYRRNPDGAWTARTTWLQGVLHSQESYDPDSDLQRYEEYNEAGAVTTTFIHRNGRVESYWSASNDADGGISMVNDLDNGDTQTWSCHNATRTCTGRTRHAVYPGGAKRNPTMTEVRGEDCKVQVRAYYEYQMDEHQNWTSRKVWLQMGEQGERVLHETDARTITYWPE